jgi:hypothetical protein
VPELVQRADRPKAGREIGATQPTWLLAELVERIVCIGIELSEG